MADSALPEKIIRELAGLWRDLGGQEQGPESDGVLRACAMTMIAATEGAREAVRVEETLADLVREHPSRAIVLRLHAGDAPLDARVLAQCWTPFGKRQQICCEQIQIDFTAGHMPGVAALLRGLTVPDLPVVLWAHSPRIFAHPGFPELLPLADKLIVDSGSFGSPSIMPQLAALQRSGVRVADLAWTRLTAWRQMIAQAFESRCCRDRLNAVSAVTVLTGEGAPPSTAVYLGAWLTWALGWRTAESGRLEPAPSSRPGPLGFRSAGGQAALRFEPVPGRPSGSLQGVRLEAPGLTLEATAGEREKDGCHVELHFESLAARTFLSDPTEYSLMREELAIAGADPHFERSLERAGEILAQRGDLP